MLSLKKRSSEIFRVMSIASLLLTMQLTHSNRLALAETQLDTNDEIVFLTSEGELQVFDPTRTGGATEVQWRSGSDKGFYDFTLGDVNNDGDMEIIAIGGDATTGRLAVFDPVVTSGINSGTINTIPWRKLVEIKLAGEPKVVAAGDFDTAVAGDEIMVGYIFSSGTTKSRVDIYHGTSANHDGSSWSKHIADKDFPNIWRDAAVGDVIVGGAEEVILIDPPSGIARVYRPDAGFAGTCEYVRTDANPYDVAIGQYINGGVPEIGIIRTYPADSTYKFRARFIVFSCNADTGQLEDVDTVNPNNIFTDPFTLIAADVNGNGDDEFFMLRNIAAQLTASAHLLGRNGGNDSLDFEVRLDADNGYQSLAGGDVDGDAKDEVVVMRGDKIRIFTDPGAGATAKTLFNDYSFSTNSYSIEIGDLDKNGFQIGYELISDKTSMSATLSAGDKLADAGLFTVKLNVDNVPKQHNAPTVEGLPSDVKVNFRQIGDDTVGTTPTSYLFDIDASASISPRPTAPYQGFIVVTSNDPEVKKPLRLPFTLTLNYARFELSTSQVSFATEICNDPSSKQSRTIEVMGTTGVTFEIANATDIAANSPWVTISPLAGTTGTTLILSFEPQKTKSLQQAVSILLKGDSKVGSTVDERIREITVSATCEKYVLLVPIDQTAMSATLNAGDELTDAGLFTVTLNMDNVAKQHNAPIIDGLPSDIKVNFHAINDATPDFTPTVYRLDIDATTVSIPRPTQPYTGFIVITGNDPEVVALKIPISVTIANAQFELSASQVSFASEICNDPSTTGTTLTLSFEPQKTKGLQQEASILLKGDSKVGITVDERIREITASATCEKYVALLPLVAR